MWHLYFQHCQALGRTRHARSVRRTANCLSLCHPTVCTSWSKTSPGRWAGRQRTEQLLAHQSLPSSGNGLNRRCTLDLDLRSLICREILIPTYSLLYPLYNPSSGPQAPQLPASCTEAAFTIPSLLCWRSEFEMMQQLCSLLSCFSNSGLTWKQLQNGSPKSYVCC